MTDSPERSGTAAGESPAVPGLLYCPYGSSYGRGCKCDNCRARIAQTMRDYRRRQAERAWGAKLPTDRVSPEATIKAITYAHNDLGLPYSEIARAVNVAKQTVEDLYFQRRAYVWRSTEERVLAAYGDKTRVIRHFDENSLIDWNQHKWKAYGLLAQGWTVKSLQQILRDHGRDAGWVDHLSDRNRLTYRSLKQLDWLVDHIGDRPGPSRNNVGRMAARGIFPLIHYTEDGRLIRGSLRPEQRECLERVPSTHGTSSGRRHGDGPRPGRG
jgi:hypothetical protein